MTLEEQIEDLMFEGFGSESIIDAVRAAFTPIVELAAKHDRDATENHLRREGLIDSSGIVSDLDRVMWDAQ
jgi:hypothetical protein